MGIVKNSLRERMRRKDIYVIVVIGITLVMMCMSGAVTLSINGVPITKFEIMMPLLLNIISVIGGGIAIALSLPTIPNEYERRTSHLVWIRGISQWNYHGQLALANIISSTGALLLLYTSIMIFAGIKGEFIVLAKGIPAFFLFALGTTVVSLFTSVISLLVPRMAAGVLAIAFMLVGTMYPALETISGILSGIARKAIRGILFVVPNLNMIHSQAANLLSEKEIQIHSVLGACLTLYVCGMVLWIFRKKEA